MASPIERVGVLGAGTMGAGIAQVAAQTGHTVVLYDIEQRFVDRGRDTISTSLARLEQRGRLSPADRAATEARLTYATDLSNLSNCQLIVEAVPEVLALKVDVLQRLHQLCGPDTIFASNTSSLSVTEIGQATGRPDHVLGMHFFNPPGLMKLVEVVRSESATPEVIEATVGLARAMGKTPVVCRDTPGFVVNRVARPFYLEALAMLGEGLATIVEIDDAARGLGFPMGPFQLIDLIGLDVNLAVSRSVYEQRFGEVRFRPSLIQRALVGAGRLGRKTGSGFYDYATEPAAPLYEHSGSVQPGPDLDWGGWPSAVRPELGGRILACLINEAYFALGEGVASASDIDTGMQLGTNYPKGLLAWGDEIGLPTVLETLLGLEDWYRDGRHAPAPLLRARAQ